MTSPEADLTGWSAAPFTGGGFTYHVFRKGEGPGVVLSPVMPGIQPGVPYNDGDATVNPLSTK